MRSFFTDCVVFLGKVAIYVLLIVAFIKLNASLPVKIILAVIVTGIILVFYCLLRLETELHLVKRGLLSVLFSVDAARLHPHDETSATEFLKEVDFNEKVREDIEKEAIGNIRGLLFFLGYVLPLGMLVGGVWLGLVHWDKIEAFISSIPALIVK